MPRVPTDGRRRRRAKRGRRLLTGKRDDGDGRRQLRVHALGGAGRHARRRGDGYSVHQGPDHAWRGRAERVRGEQTGPDVQRNGGGAFDSRRARIRRGGGERVHRRGNERRFDGRVHERVRRSSERRRRGRPDVRHRKGDERSRGERHGFRGSGRRRVGRERDCDRRPHERGERAGRKRERGGGIGSQYHGRKRRRGSNRRRARGGCRRLRAAGVRVRGTDHQRGDVRGRAARVHERLHILRKRCPGRHDVSVRNDRRDGGGVPRGDGRVHPEMLGRRGRDHGRSVVWGCGWRRGADGW